VARRDGGTTRDAEPPISFSKSSFFFFFDITSRIDRVMSSFAASNGYSRSQSACCRYTVSSYSSTCANTALPLMVRGESRSIAARSCFDSGTVGTVSEIVSHTPDTADTSDTGDTGWSSFLFFLTDTDTDTVAAPKLATVSETLWVSFA